MCSSFSFRLATFDIILCDATVKWEARVKRVSKGFVLLSAGGPLRRMHLRQLIPTTMV